PLLVSRIDHAVTLVDTDVGDQYGQRGSHRAQQRGLVSRNRDRLLRRLPCFNRAVSPWEDSAHRMNGGYRFRLARDPFRLLNSSAHAACLKLRGGIIYRPVFTIPLGKSRGDAPAPEASVAGAPRATPKTRAGPPRKCPSTEQAWQNSPNADKHHPSGS